MPKINGPSPRSRCWSNSTSRMRAAWRRPIEHLVVAGVVALVAAMTRSAAATVRWPGVNRAEQHLGAGW